MNKDIPRWITSDYDGAEQDLAEFLQVALFDEVVLEKAILMLKGRSRMLAGLIFKGFSATAIAAKIGEEDITQLTEDITGISKQIEINKAKLIGDDETRARIEAEVKARALQRTEQLPDLAERSFIYQAYEAEKEGWYTLLDGEFDNLLEFMMGYLSNIEAGSTRYYRMDFIVRTILPFLESQGISPKKLYGVSAAPTKAMMIVPAAKYGWELHGDDPKELTKWLMDLMEKVVDPAYTVASIKEHVSQIQRTSNLSGDLDNKITHNGNVYVIPADEGGQEFMIVLRASNHVQAEIIQRKLKGVIPDFHVGNFAELAKSISSLIGPGERKKK